MTGPRNEVTELGAVVKPFGNFVTVVPSVFSGEQTRSSGLIVPMGAERIDIERGVVKDVGELLRSSVLRQGFEVIYIDHRAIPIGDIKLVPEEAIIGYAEPEE